MFKFFNVLSTNGQQHEVASNKITGSITTFAVDSNLDIIYFVDSGSSSLYKYDIISCQQRFLTSISSAKGKGWCMYKNTKKTKIYKKKQKTNTIKKQWISNFVTFIAK